MWGFRGRTNYIFGKLIIDITYSLCGQFQPTKSVQLKRRKKIIKRSEMSLILKRNPIQTHLSTSFEFFHPLKLFHAYYVLQKCSQKCFKDHRLNNKAKW